MITPETHNNSTVLLDELTSIVRNFSMDDLVKKKFCDSSLKLSKKITIYHKLKKSSE